MSAPPQETDNPENIDDSGFELVHHRPRLLFYFGCENSSVGHFLWSQEWRPGLRGTFNPGALFSALDGAFCPPDQIPEGIFKKSVVQPWTIVSWWDRSVDSRPGSHSTFILEGQFDAIEVLRRARIKFPSVFARQRCELKPLSYWEVRKH